MAPVAPDESPVIVVDTHVLVWWAAAPDKLSRRAAQALADADRIGVPAVVFWEVAVLHRRGKVLLGVSPTAWTRAILSLSRVESLPLLPEIAVSAVELQMHPDPADRFIAATAIHHAVSLVTKDRAIRASKVVPTIW
jgi:PIN domain nuclease of toxin-antitoxin system